MEQELATFRSSVKTSISKKKNRFFTIPRLIIFFFLICILFFLFYEAMRYFCCTRPLRKGAEAEYEVYINGNEENDDTYIKKIETDKVNGCFQLEISKSIKDPHCLAIYLSEPVTIDGIEYWLDVSYLPYSRWWSELYIVGLDYNANPHEAYYKGVNIDKNGTLVPDSSGEITAENREYAEMFKEYYLPMLEELKKEYQHIMDTY